MNNVTIDQVERLEIRNSILEFQEKMNLVPGAFIGDSEHCPLKHSFSDGLYVREIFIPKGTILVGKLHKHDHPNFLMQGEVSVLTEEGPKRIKAPCSMISPAGTKRIVYANEDTVWITVHLNPTNTHDLVQLEEEIIAKTYEELESPVIDVPKLEVGQ